MNFTRTVYKIYYTEKDELVIDRDALMWKTIHTFSKTNLKCTITCNDGRRITVQATGSFPNHEIHINAWDNDGPTRSYHLVCKAPYMFSLIEYASIAGNKSVIRNLEETGLDEACKEIGRKDMIGMLYPREMTEYIEEHGDEDMMIESVPGGYAIWKSSTDGSFDRYVCGASLEGSLHTYSNAFIMRGAVHSLIQSLDQLDTKNETGGEKKDET